ncbi:MAG: CmcJ/NvfI family oxidoreductase [Myxococcota bacterium]
MHTTGRVNYHVHADHPQQFELDPDGHDGTLIAPELAPTDVTVHDVRDLQPPLSFHEDGLGFATLATAAQNLTDPDQPWRATYDDELAQFLRARLSATDVRVFDHTLRVDDPDARRRPARNVHGDYSPAGGRQRLIDLLGPEEAASWERGHYAFVNVWRPVGEVIRSAPLGFVRPRTVAPADWVGIDLAYPNRTGHILGLVANPEHAWIYRASLRPDEVAFFVTHDNRGGPVVPHSAFDAQSTQGPPKIRRSLESRTLVRFSAAPSARE